MLARVLSAAVNGIEAYPVEVEVNAGWGDTIVMIVGLPDAAVKESRERGRLGGLEFAGSNSPEGRCHQIEKAYIHRMQTEVPGQDLVAVTVRIPLSVAAQFGSDSDRIARHLLEQATVEGYRSNQLSRDQVAQMLGFDWAETEEFLAKHHCDRHYNLEDLDKDRRSLNSILGPA